jgi:murein DD-endopeptidase MepM/ murein hydrolase activator NlpD
MRLRLLVLAVAIPLVLWGVLPLVSSGASSARVASLESKIEKKRSAVGRVRGKERVLASDVAAYTRRIGRLQSDIVVLQRRQIRIQADLDAKQAELERIQAELRAERARLVRLRARLAETRAALGRRIVELYKADKPDAVTVILEADGFADLLERAEFMRRVSSQDAHIIDLVVQAKAEATATEARLDRLERRQQRIAAAIMARRDEVSRVRSGLVEKRNAYAEVRSEKRTVLVATRDKRQDLEGDLRALEAEQARVANALRNAAARAPGSNVAGPIRQGSGSLIWPVNGSVVSPFGMRWGRLHAGIDIAAPTGTPIRAADSGKVVLLGVMGGYGNYTCVQHNASLSTCYAHQSRYATSNGASVSKGQVIGYVGCTGHCFGDHLHFETRVGGSPVDPMGYL